MPEIDLSPGAKLFYRDEDFTDPWRTPEAVMMLHGFSESSIAWNGWVPHFARKYRVIRPDMRGYGSSTPMPIDYPWSIEGLIDDYLLLADRLGIERFHLVGAKIGGAISLRTAARCPERVLSVTLTGARVISRVGATTGKTQQLSERWQREGMLQWARDSMPDRLGTGTGKEFYEGFIQMMAATPVSTVAGFVLRVPGVDLAPDLPNVRCPVLNIIPDAGGPELTERTRERVAMIPRAELLVLHDDAAHIAATQPDACARASLAFIERTVAKREPVAGVR